MGGSDDLLFNLDRAAGCSYSLAAFLAMGLAVFAAAKLKRSMGAWALAAGLLGTTFVAVSGDVLVFAELESGPVIWLGLSALGIVFLLVATAGIALLKQPDPEGGSG